jgi:hypothetical protein
MAGLVPAIHVRPQRMLASRAVAFHIAERRGVDDGRDDAKTQANGSVSPDGTGTSKALIVIEISP